jgi:hypothetical protein
MDQEVNGGCRGPLGCLEAEIDKLLTTDNSSELLALLKQNISGEKPRMNR